MGFRRRDTQEARIDITPMVDVVFLLLVFFMISTTFVETPGLDIRLPEASAEAIAREPEELKVFLSRQGEISVADERLDMAGLRQLLEGYGERARETIFVLLADADARHGQVVAIMDAARAAGFSRLAIATDPATDAR